jgi:FKBP-type peptidyl-prolyl cis-trans isomerase
VGNIIICGIIISEQKEGIKPMAKNQRILIFVIIGIFMLSTFATAILFLTSGNNTDTNAADEISKQLEELQAQQQTEEQAKAAAAACAPLPAATSPGARTIPEYELPTADITELKIVDVTVGKGKEVKAGDCIVAYYHGTLPDGTVFDSAFERGLPNRFSLQRVIEGWQEGIPGMKVGGVRVLYIPSELGYGEAGSEPIIGPNQDLVFIVELVEVVE